MCPEKKIDTELIPYVFFIEDKITKSLNIDEFFKNFEKLNSLVLAKYENMGNHLLIWVMKNLYCYPSTNCLRLFHKIKGSKGVLGK